MGKEPDRRAYRLVAAGMLGTLLACGLALAAYQWMFGEYVHRRAGSPDDRWAVEVTKRMETLGTVEVRLRVVPVGAGLDRMEVHIDHRDLWGDIEPGSYEVTWLSGTEFRVADKEPGSAPRWRGRLVGGFWVVGGER